MNNKKVFRYTLLTVFLTIALSACTLPGFSTPTPFEFPTPDKTMTALFEPTEPAPATSAATETSMAEPTEAPTEPPEPTNTVVPTDTQEPTDTAEETPEPTESYAGPSQRPGPDVRANYLSDPPKIDSHLTDWDVGIQKIITHVVYGADKHTGELDSSGTVVIGWDEDYLYMGIRVKDDKYVQIADRQNIYKGDSFEILFDTHVSSDYYLASLDWDDYQIGISPGKGNPSLDTECYIWYPASKEGSTCEIKAAAKTTGKGYFLEMAIPWDLLNITPVGGRTYGFAISISDNDSAGKAVQQSMVSNVSTRSYLNPKTWGNLILKPAP